MLTHAGRLLLLMLVARFSHQEDALVFGIWCQKERPTFSDAIASVRYQIWKHQNFSMSTFSTDIHNLNDPLFKQLIIMAIRAKVEWP